MCAEDDHALKQREIELKQKEFELKQKEYNLKLDEEAANFLGSKQKLTYFLISSAVAIDGLLLDFTFKNRASISIPTLLIVLPSISGVLSAGASLLSLHFLHKSFKLHLVYRHDAKDWTQLTDEQRAEWDRVNENAANALFYAFAFLFAEVFLSALFMLGAFFR